MKAWHFIREDWTTWARRIPVVVGESLHVEPPVVLCEWGLHASLDPRDALGHAPGPVVCRVEISGEIVRGDDKLAATYRRVLWAYDASAVLWHFARLCALDVVRLWDPPDVIAQWLRTGNKDTLDDAKQAAWASAWQEAWEHTKWAASNAARIAAWHAVGGSAGISPRISAWAAAWATARDSALAAAWVTTREEVRVSTLTYAWECQSQRLAGMLREGRPK